MPLTPEEWLNEFLTNTTDSAGGFDDQQNARITQLSNGNLLIVWDSNANPGSGAGSSPGTDVIGRIFDPLGNAVTGELQLNTSASADVEQQPEITALDGGGFVVTYVDFDFQIGNGAETDIRAEVYNNSGVFQRSMLVVNDVFGGDNYTDPVVASASDTSVMFMYVNNDEDVMAKIYNPQTGALTVAEFTVLNATAVDGIGGVDIVAMNTGEYATVVIDEDASPDNDDIYIDVFNTAGVNTHSRIISNAWPEVADPSLTVLDNGNIVLTYFLDGSGGSNTGIRFRILNDSLGDVTGQLNPVTTETGNQTLPDVASLADGGFVIAWYDVDTNDIHAQRYNAAGAKVGVEYNVVAYGSSEVTSIDLATMEDGRFAITWTRDVTGSGNEDVYTAIWDTRDNANTTPVYDNNMQIGTIGNDTFTVNSATEEVYGHNGNDVILINSADEIGVEYYGGAGTDTLQMRDVGIYSLSSATISGFEELKFNDGAGTGARSATIFASQFAQFNTLDFAQSSGQIDTITIFMGGTNSVDYSGLTIQDFVSADDTIIIDGDSSAETIVGTDVNDTIRGGAGLDTLDGHTGFDTLDLSDGGYAGTVTTNLQAGTISSSQGAETAINFENFNGSAVNDVITGTDAHANELYGNNGNDTFDGGDFADRMYGGAGNDTFIINGADDIDDGFEIIEGGTGTDRVFVNGVVNNATTVNLRNESFDSIEQIEFSNAIVGDVDLELQFNAIQFNNGSFSLTSQIRGFNSAGDTETMTIFMTSEASLDLSGLTFANWGGQGDIVEIYGDLTAETITSTTQRDLVLSGNGNDVVRSLSGNDELFGGNGDDQLEAGSGSDIVNGDGGDDRLYNNADGNTNTLNGGADNDTWILGTISGGFSGTDWTIDLASGTSTGGTTTVNTSFIENVTAGNGDDNITGDGNANVLEGNGGADIINGGAGNDTLDGGNGDDIMTGGAGTDTFDGGAGTDTIDYSANSVGGLIDANVVDTGIATFGGITETWDNVENFITGSGDDIFLWSGAGSTVFDLDGGGGTDRFDASNSSSNWNVNLSTGEADIGTTLRANLSNIEDVTGNNTNNTIIGNSFNNTLIGGSGNDFLSGGGGTADVVIGGLGDDTLEVGTSGSSIFQGNEGNDRLGFNLGGINGFQAGNTLDGGDDIDTLDFSNFNNSYIANLSTGVFSTTGGAFANTLANIENVDAGNGDDIITGDIGANVLDGNNGNDTIYGGSGNDTINGGDGNDFIVGGGGVDTMNGGNGTDTLSYAGAGVAIDADMEAGISTIVGGQEFFSSIEVFISGNGSDTILGSSTADTVFGEGGDDTVNGAAGNDVLNGATGNDILTGNSGDDILNGGDDNDILNGGGDNDTINGGSGNDIANGQAGDDIINGGDGLDELLGAAGNDTIDGGAGVDTINGNGGDDTIDGGTGNDDLRGAVGFDTVSGGDGDDIISGGNQNDTLNGDAGNDTLNGDAGNDIVNGGDNNDTLNGASGQDVLNGDAGNDTLFGDAGGDDLFGGAGDDILNGGGDNDDLNGGSGVDTFVMNLGFKTDRIQDFEDGTDLIDFSGNVLANDIGDVLAAATQVGANVRIDLNANNTLIIENFDLADLDASDFIF